MEWFSLVNFPGLNLVLEKEAKQTFKNCEQPAWQNKLSKPMLLSSSKENG